MTEFAGKVVVVTGAGSGTGRATALLFALEDAKVSLIEQDESSVRATAELISRSRVRRGRDSRELNHTGRDRYPTSSKLSEGLPRSRR
jgi:NAD(P)-dependent dehydrogenase (short-subunit alcohol dehydrogenase family)